MSSSSSSTSDKKDDVVQSYNPEKGISSGNQDLENNNEDDIYSEHLRTVLSDPKGIERIQSLARTLSKRVASQGRFQVDPEDFDLKVLLHYLNAKGMEQGIEDSAAGIAFKNVTAKGIDVSAAYGPSVEELARNLLSAPLRLFQKNTKPIRNIIQNVTGVVKTGEMCLVIGRPGSGCSTFLKCCSGEVSELYSTEGEFSYDGLNQKQMMEKFKGYVVYNPELDTHFPHLKVKDTIDFAIKVKTPAKRIDGLSREEYITTMRDLWCTVFGLRHTYNTKVGNDFVRGVSGGERKRVSIVEALACNASIYAWDNATRGLDASTALEFTQAIRTATNLLNNSAIVAIYQAGENIYDLFDKVTVLYLGRQIYFGPAIKAKAYFEKMGWKCPPRMTTPEFLTSVTDPNGRTPIEGMEEKVPKTADQFEQYWLQSPDYQEVIDEHNEYSKIHSYEETKVRLDSVTVQRKEKFQREKSKFVVSYPSQVKHLMTRGFQRQKGEISYLFIYMCTFIIKGLIIGSCFWNIPQTTTGAYSRAGILFYCLFFSAATSLAEISHSFAYRPIILKQKSYSMYHQSAEALQEIITEFPSKFIAVIILALSTYWLANLKRTAGGFFMYLLFLLQINQCMSFLFKIVANVSKSGESAFALAGLIVLLLCIYTGFVLPLPQMHHWAKWINYLNPMRYALEMLIGSEFHHREMLCQQIVPTGPGYENVPIENQVCAFSGSLPGRYIVSGDNYIKASYNYEWSHVWRNFGINMAFTIGFMIINVIISEFVKSVQSGGDMLLFKRGHMPNTDGEVHDNGVGSRDEMIKLLNGADVDLKKLIDEKETFSWQNVDYLIPYEGATRQLLDNIQGYVKPGTMTALMGESGAGKTTLLNVLSQRINFGVITGDMLVNGHAIDSSFQRRTGYVQQQDLHLAESSVREALRFAAELRQPANIPIKEKHEYVEKIISLLGMQDYAEAIIGKTGRGLNVEQRKKLSIGVELVAKPSLLLFLDEPTSGLDSQSAWSIIQFLRALADSGQAILCTIHQPSATLFEVFDRLLLLKKGGKTVYFGDIGPNSSTMLSYFERQSGIKCEKSENPAEYILNRIGAGATAHANSDWNDLWVNSPEYAQTTADIAKLNKDLASDKKSMDDDELLKSKFASNWLTQFYCVFRRTGTQFWRSPIYIAAKFFVSIICSLFVGFSFFNVNHSYGAASQPLLSIFMMLIIALALINQMHIFAFPSRELFEVRESASNTFHWSALLLSQTLWEILWSWLGQFFSFCCFYWPAKFNGSAAECGYFFLIFVIMMPLFYVTFGLAIIYFSPNVPSASIITSMLFPMLMLFCGIIQPYSLLPKFWSFMYKVSPFTYFVQSLISPIIHDRYLKCEQSEFNVLTPPTGQSCSEYLDPYISTHGGYLQNPNAVNSCHYCPFTSQETVMETFNIKWKYRWRNFGFIWVYIIFNVFAMLGMYYLLRVKVWKSNSIKDLSKSEESKDTKSVQTETHSRDEES